MRSFYFLEIQSPIFKKYTTGKIHIKVGIFFYCYISPSFFLPYIYDVIDLNVKPQEIWTEENNSIFKYNLIEYKRSSSKKNLRAIMNTLYNFIKNGVFIDSLETYQNIALLYNDAIQLFKRTKEMNLKLCHLHRILNNFDHALSNYIQVFDIFVNVNINTYVVPTLLL